MQSFALADNPVGVVDLTQSGILREGYWSGTVLDSSVQSFAVSNGGQSVYWLDPGGNVNGSVNGGSTQPLDGDVTAFASADSGMDLVLLFGDGASAEGVPHYYMHLAGKFWRDDIRREQRRPERLLAGHGRQRVRVRQRRQAQPLDSGVTAFASADSGMDLVLLFADGALAEGVPHYYMSSLAGSGVQSFAVSNGGQSVYWLDTAGNLAGPSTAAQLASRWMGAWRRSPRPTAGWTSFILFSDGCLATGVPHYYVSDLASSGVQSFAVGNGGQGVYWLTSGGILNQSLSGGYAVYGGSYLVTNNVQSYTLTDGGMALVIDFANGSVEDIQPGYWDTWLVNNPTPANGILLQPRQPHLTALTSRSSAPAGRHTWTSNRAPRAIAG